MVLMLLYLELGVHTTNVLASPTISVVSFNYAVQKRWYNSRIQQRITDSLFIISQIIEIRILLQCLDIFDVCIFLTDLQSYNVVVWSTSSVNLGLSWTTLITHLKCRHD